MMMDDSLSDDQPHSVSLSLRSSSDGKCSPSADSENMDPTTSAESVHRVVQETRSTIGSGADEEGDREHNMSRSPSHVSQSLSDRMRRLTATAWALEQDDEMTETRRRRIYEILQKLETTIEEEERSSDIGDEKDVLSQTTADQRFALDQPRRRQAKRSTISTDSGPAELMTRTSIADDDRHENEESENGMGSEYQSVDRSELDSVHESLRHTVESMRLRHQEQRHLHALTIQKLEMVSQRCLAQDSTITTQTHMLSDQQQQLNILKSQLTSLRSENKELLHENNSLKEQEQVLREDAERKEIAVTAMASAVKGLEGWIDSTALSPSTPTKQARVNGYRADDQEDHDLPHRYQLGHHGNYRPLRRGAGDIDSNGDGHSNSTQTRRSIVRGKGRFRGRYYIDEHSHRDSGTTSSPRRQDTNNPTPSPAGATSLYTVSTEAQDLQDGVKAWIRGFKDVEECASSPAPTYRAKFDNTSSRSSTIMTKNGQLDGIGNDDWGEFQSPARGTGNRDLDV